MLFPHILVAIAGCVLINLHIGNNQDVPNLTEDVTEVPEEDNEEPEEEEDPTPSDKHTFVALIDIQFTDGTKRSCTGTLIHDNVVVTAAHCFIDCNNEYVMPELTLSFVVIGTKKMFEAGYEKYLPIERIVTHPRFEGWTADIALVYTFAGMTSDKPGKTIPISGEKSVTPVDSNITVLSWGKCSKRRGHKLRSRPVQRNRPDSSHELKKDVINYRLQDHSAENVDPMEEEDQIFKTKTTKRSRYLTSSEIRVAGGHMLPVLKNEKVFVHESPATKPRTRTRRISKRIRTTTKTRAQTKNTIVRRRYTPKHRTSLTGYESWRRSMGSTQNELLVQTFGFVSVQACKKLVERAMPDMYNFKHIDEILCYTSEDHFITKEDSGAPGIQQAHLVAVTVGGVEAGGEHIAVGMKMACFCAWIVENLPDTTETQIKCCKNCCDPETEKEQKQVQRARLRKKKTSRFADNDNYDSIEYTLMKEVLQNRRILNVT